MNCLKNRRNHVVNGIENRAENIRHKKGYYIMLLRIAYCDDEIENGKKIRDYINQLMIQIEVEFELDLCIWNCITGKCKKTK